MLESIHTFDVYITELIANLLPQNEFFDIFFSFLSLNGMSIFVWIVMIIYLVYVRHKEDKTFIPTFIVGYGATSLLVDVILKNLIQRTRPWMTQGLEEAFCPSNFSFPSGHASASFAGATLFAAYDPKRKFLYYSIAILISLSRVYLICHYVLDVLFGALAGYLVVKLVLYIKDNRNKLWDIQQN